MAALHYFAYGSNMSLERMHARIPAARFFGVACAQDFDLAFHKISDLDGSGKCDLVSAPGRSAFGVLYRLSPHDLRRLDAIEGRGYRRSAIQVSMAGMRVGALTYGAVNIDTSLKPFDWYHHHVLCGAKRAQLPQHYVRTIARVDCQADSNPERAKRELAIYTSRQIISRNLAV